MKKFILTIAVFLIAIDGIASALMTLTGTHYSSNDREIGIQRGSKVYYIDRRVFSKNGQSNLINAKGTTTIRVQMSDIMRVESLNETTKPQRDISSLKN